MAKSKYVATMRLKLDAETRIHPGEVVTLTAEEAAPLLEAGAIERVQEDKAAKQKGGKAPADAPEPPAPHGSPDQTEQTGAAGSDLLGETPQA